MPLNKRINRLARKQMRLRGKTLLAKGRKKPKAKRIRKLTKRATRTGARLQIAKAKKVLRSL